MNVTACRFHVNARSAADFPRDGSPEVAFMGRSNVGKSSLINRLLGVRGLARTSKTPGRTRSIHYYRVNDRVYFVDLPGYGYARVSRPMREEWRGLVEAYLSRPGRPDLAVQLVDSRHEPTALDRELNDWIRVAGLARQVVLTKSDKLTGSERNRSVQTATRLLELAPGERAIAVSVETGDGIPALWREIDAACGTGARRETRSEQSDAPPPAGGAVKPINADGGPAPRR
jgi:GTP-binding protein